MTPEIPRLSPSIAKIMWNRSPAHAYQAHRLLGGGTDKESTDAQNTGKIIEALVFNQPLDKFAVLEFDSYRTKDAQNARDEANAARLTPILSKDLEPFQTAARIIRERIAEHGVKFDHGEFQKLVEWDCPTGTGARCKGYLDYFQDGGIHDLKTTTDASPRKMQRQFVDMGYDIQNAAYIEGIEATIPELAGRVKMTLWVAETEPPYLVFPYQASGEMHLLGAEKWHRAKQQWSDGIERNYWPGYFSGTGLLSPTPWQMGQIGEDFETKETSK